MIGTSFDLLFCGFEIPLAWLPKNIPVSEILLFSTRKIQYICFFVLKEGRSEDNVYLTCQIIKFILYLKCHTTYNT